MRISGPTAGTERLSGLQLDPRSALCIHAVRELSLSLSLSQLTIRKRCRVLACVLHSMRSIIHLYRSEFPVRFAPLIAFISRNPYSVEFHLFFLCWFISLLFSTKKKENNKKKYDDFMPFLNCRSYSFSWL